MNYQQHFATRQTVTPQNQPIPGTTQMPNSAGGYAWEVDDWARLDRFLILGAEGGTYYVGERELTIQNATAVQRCIEVDGMRVVKRVVEISQDGRSAKNDPSLFVLAMCAGAKNLDVRKEALTALPYVARIGTHLFHFAQYVEAFRGWGRGLKTAMRNWYQDKPVGALAYQAIKYQQRDGWSHRDLLRLSKPKTDDETRNLLYKWVTKGTLDLADEPGLDHPLRQLWAFERAKKATAVYQIVALINAYRLTWEMLQAQWLKEPAVWKALIPDMPLTAMIRNLGRMTACKAITPMSKEEETIRLSLANGEALKKARIHPISILSALRVYAQGEGDKGSLTWEPNQGIIDSLDAAFYTAFGSITPTGKRLVLGVDVSRSMASDEVAGVPGLTARDGAAVMSLVTAATEQKHAIMGFSHQFVPLPITPRQRLDDVIRTVGRHDFGRTDCALPMLWARENQVVADAFVIYTDSETWSGNIHPPQALRQYRQWSGLDAKLIVVAMTSNGFSIADPNDKGMMDVVGFDTATPEVISRFVRGEI